MAVRGSIGGESEEKSPPHNVLSNSREARSPSKRKPAFTGFSKVQINMYAAGLHRQGSGAVTHYTMLELADRFKLMNLAFDQEDYRVDKNLEVIPLPEKKDC